MPSWKVGVYHQSKQDKAKPGCTARQMLQLPDTQILHHPPLPASPGIVTTSVSLRSAFPLQVSPARVDTLPSAELKPHGGSGQEGSKHKLPGKTSAESCWGGHVPACMHGDSYVFGCKRGKQKRLSNNGEMKVVCELETMVPWEWS